MTVDDFDLVRMKEANVRVETITAPSLALDDRVRCERDAEPLFDCFGNALSKAQDPAAQCVLIER